MSHLLDEHDDLLAAPARELTLSTGSILAIFFGLGLLCALFFGLGYNVGHRSANAAALSARPDAQGTPSPNTAAGSPSDAFSGFKPPASTAAGKPPASNAEAAAQPENPALSANAVVPRASTSPVAAPIPAPHAATAPRSPETSTPATRPASETPQSSATNTAPAGTFVVQVAAVSHPEDALLLVGALRTRGYTVAERSDPADKLIHIQIGPFASKPTAEATRQRLQADGYNAFIK